MLIRLALQGAMLLFLVVSFLILGTSSTTFNVVNLGLISYLIYNDQKRRFGRLSLRHIPRVPSWPVVGSLPYLEPEYSHVDGMKFAKQLGPVIRFITPDGVMVCANSYDAIRDVCITNAKAAAGRPRPFLTNYMLNGTGILFSHEADSTWKSLRMVSHKHLKQFGEGRSHLEYVISDVAEEMFTRFDDMVKAGASFNPKPVIFDAALNTIAFLVTGVRNKAGDAIVEKMREYERTALSFIGNASDIKFSDYDNIPWIRHLNLSTWKIVEGTKRLQTSIWKDVQDMNVDQPELTSLYKGLMENTQEGTGKTKFVDEDVKMTVMSLLLAGVTTTSTSFYALINILAHHPDIQEKLFTEVKTTGKTNEQITLLDRQNMPYCRAVLYELLRYASVVPFGVPHRTIADVDIAGVKVPAETTIVTNIFNLHHDSAYWEDPFTFKPERFLDDNGDVVTADHPNRKHLMPFGAGARVCLGEALALARLFLWIASFSQRYQVYPGEGNTVELCDCRKYKFDGVIRVCRYEVKLTSRDSYKH